MAEVREGRRLAAIMFMDMVGYSARMQRNEERAISAVQSLWTLVRPIIATHGGREVDLAGDGMLMEFDGALAAVQCSMQVHAELERHNAPLDEAERVRTRAGVHIGDIEHRSGRVYGDGVNIAARVIGFSPAGATAMTVHVRDQLLNVLDHPAQRLGLRRLKNIRAPMEIWCLPGPECSGSELRGAQRDDEEALRKWTFGSATFNERTFELEIEGQPVSLEKASLKALLFLLHHAGEVVTQDELLAALPAGSELDEAVRQLRAGLRDAQERIIATVHGFGYRLAAAVRMEALDASETAHFDFFAGMNPPLRSMWSLVERLGSGGHGEAWLARHDKTRELRVFKFALDVSALASLKREITLSRVLRDTLGERPDLVRVLDWNLETAPYFIESEYSNAGNLAIWAEAQGGIAQVPLTTRLELASQIADALSAAHSVGVLHKDLKPGNVLIDTRGGDPQVRLCDFGSGGVLDTERLEQLGITRMGFTKTVLDLDDSTSGTPLYLAPEIIAGQPFTAHADIYAAGVVLYQIVVGDFRRALALGWEHDIEDELLREDIAAAAAGTASRRLPDASLLAQRLRTLERRRAERLAAREAQLQAERAERTRQQLKRTRMAATLLVVLAGTMGAVGFVAYRERNAALEAAATTQAVSNFLVSDVLAVADPNLGPLKDLTLKEQIDRSATVVGDRLGKMPEAEAKVRIALSMSYGWLNYPDLALREVRKAVQINEQAFGSVAEQSPGAQPIVRLAENAWWSARQALAANGAERERVRFETALEELARQDPYDAAALTACRDLIRGAAQNTALSDERAQSLLGAVAGKGIRGATAVRSED